MHSELNSFLFDCFYLIVLSVSVVPFVAILLQFHNSHTEKISCLRTPDAQQSTSSTSYGTLFSSVLGTEGQHNYVPPNLAMLLLLLQLCAKLIQASKLKAGATERQAAAPNTATPTQQSDATMMSADDYEVAEITNNQMPAVEHLYSHQQLKNGCERQQQSRRDAMDANQYSCQNIADNVLQHQATMTRLLVALTQSTNSSFSLLVASFSSDDDVSGGDRAHKVETFAEASKTTAALHSQYVGAPYLSCNEPASLADAVFDVLILLGRLASRSTSIIQPIVQYLKQSK